MAKKTLEEFVDEAKGELESVMSAVVAPGVHEACAILDRLDRSQEQANAYTNAVYFTASNTTGR